MTKVRVFVVEANELMRTGIELALDSAGDLELIGAATTINEATARLPLADPDVALVDLDLPDGCGTRVLAFLRSHGAAARRLAITPVADDPIVAHAVEWGADAVVTNRVSVDDLVDAIRRVAAGKSLTDQRHREHIEELAEATDHDEHLARLTPQEHVLLEHLSRGLTNREIAEAMGLSDKTVKNYVSSVMMKLEVTHRAAAAAYFVRIEATLPCASRTEVPGDHVFRY